MQKYLYCETWSLNFKEARNPMNEEQGKKIHEKLYGTSNKPLCGQKFPTMKRRGGVLSYTVVIGSLEKPTAFAEFVSNSIWVNFLDDKLRAYLDYSFDITDNGKLFLGMAVHREFEGDSDKVSKGTMYLFKEDGRLIIERETFLPDHSIERAENTMDVLINYEDFPTFGEYEALLKTER